MGTPSQDLRRSHYDPRATMAVWRMQHGQSRGVFEHACQNAAVLCLHPREAKERRQKRFDLEGVFKEAVALRMFPTIYPF
ncbi:MAG: hypothetical protein R3B54_04990 [Bdellovibrionota bacterium]